jgi:nitroreductase
MDSIFHRTSVRNFTNQKVEQDKIDFILKAAMAAPSAGNQQPWVFYVTENKEILEQLAACSPYAGPVKNAPMAFIPCYREDVIYPPYAQIDLSIATEHILLAADSLGLGTVWLGIAPLEDRMNTVSKILNLPADVHPFAVVPCGYPARIAPQQERYDASRIHYIK